MSIPDWIMAELDYVECSVCGDLVTVKGRATHVVCALARTQEDYSFPVTFVAGAPEYAKPQEDS